MIRRIYRKITLDNRGRVIEEDSYLYKGEIVKCFGGGGGGTVESTTPQYLQDLHSDLMRGVQESTSYGSGEKITSGLVQTMNDASTSLGPNLVTNGSFTGNADGWSLGTGWTYNSNEAWHEMADINDGARGHLTQAGILTTGSDFVVEFDVVYWVFDIGPPTLDVYFGTALAASATGVGHYKVRGSCVGNATLKFTGNWNIKIDNVVVNKVIGTSPYVGKSVYDPTVDLSNTESEYNLFNTLVDNLSHTADWTTVIDAAITKADEQFSAEDISTTVADIITSALTDATSAATSAHSDSETGIKNIASAFFTASEENAKSLVNTLSGEGETAAFGIIKDAINTLTDVQSGETKTFLDKIVDIAQAGAATDVASIEGSAKTAAKDQAVEMLTKATQEGVADANALTGAAKIITATNVSSILNAAKTLTKTNVEAVLDDARADSTIESAVIISAVKTLAETDTDNIISAIRTSSASDVSTIVAAAQTLSLDNLDAILVAGAAKASADIASVISTAITAIKTDATGVVSSAITSALGAISSAPIQGVVDAFEKRGVKPLARSVNRFTAGMADINAVHSSAFAIGLALLESEHLDKVKEFDAETTMSVFDRALPLYTEVFTSELSQYMGAYVNEVTSYMELSMRNISEHLRLYDGEIGSHTQLYDSTQRGYQGVHEGWIDRYIGRETSKTAEYIDIEGRETQSFFSFFSTSVREFMQTFTRILPEYLSTYLGTIPAYMQTYQSTLPTQSGVAQASLESGVRAAEGLQSGKMRAASSAISDELGVFSDIFQRQLREQIATNTDIRKEKDIFINQAASEMTKMLATNVEFSKSLVSVLAEINRMKLVAMSEFKEGEVDLAVDQELWNLKLFQYAGNLLSSVGGGGVVVPERMSKTQSALGGALSGAVVGAQIGGAPGAVVGGIGGLIAGAS